jgi:hypothetical protein
MLSQVDIHTDTKINDLEFQKRQNLELESSMSVNHVILSKYFVSNKITSGVYHSHQTVEFNINFMDFHKKLKLFEL